MLLVLRTGRGLPIPLSHITNFKNCMLRCGLVETVLRGCKYTWGCRGMATSIDKLLANYALLTKCPNLVTIARPDQHSDHTPLLL